MFIIKCYVEGFIIADKETGDRKFLTIDEIDILREIYKQKFYMTDKIPILLEKLPDGVKIN